mmetsp:Transcript_12780/g.33376  ORF Transcript_12780/g.33376 Transcript_12780/m.33376 type:complete len:226 (-) Transcript_12780:2375-3052(-)
MPMPHTPGTTHMRSPPTPLLAGRPTSTIHLPAPLYMPQLIITVTVCATRSAGRTSSFVSGLRPLLAKVAPITAASSAVVCIEHAMVYASRAAIGSPMRICLCESSRAILLLFELVSISDLKTVSSSTSRLSSRAISLHTLSNLAYRSLGSRPSIIDAEHMAPAFTYGLKARLWSSMLSASKGWPLGSSPIFALTLVVPCSCIASMYRIGLHADWIVNGVVASPTT